MYFSVQNPLMACLLHCSCYCNKCLNRYCTLSFLRSLCHVAGSTINHSTHSGEPPRLGALCLLLGVLACDGLALMGCTALFYEAGWSMLLLLTCDCILLGNNALCHIVRHVAARWEEAHRSRIAELEERILRIHDTRRDVDESNISAVEHLEEQSRICDREVEVREAGHSQRLVYFDRTVFTLELCGSFMSAVHYIHIWYLHGASFGLLDGVLLLHLQSTLSSVGRKVNIVPFSDYNTQFPHF